MNLADTHVTDGVLKYLAKLPQLAALDLRSTRISEEGLRHLAPLKTLATLSMNSDQLTDEMIGVLLEIDLLRSVELTRGVGVSPKVASKLLDSNSLNLRESKVTDAALKHVTRLTKLTSLDLTTTKVTAAGLKELAPLTKLNTLYLSEVGNETLASLKEASLLHALPLAKGATATRPTNAEEVTSLDLTPTGVTGDGLKHLDVLTNLTTLNLPKTMQLTDAAAKGFASLKHLTTLTLDGPLITDGVLAALGEAHLLHALSRARGTVTQRPSKAEEVTSLDLTHTKVTDAGVSALAPLTNLTSLNLSYTKVKDAGLKDLAPLKKLTTLTLDATQLTDRSLDALRENNLLHTLARVTPAFPKNPTKVVSLDLRFAKLTEAGARAVASLTQLTALDMRHTPVTGAMLEELAPLKQLTALSLDSDQITDEVVAVLVKVNLFHTLDQCVAAGLVARRPSKLEDVTSLVLGKTKVTEAALKHVAKMPQLATLNLGGANVKAAGLKELAPLKNLVTLDIRSPQITGETLTALREVNLLHTLSVATTADRKRPAKPDDVASLDLSATGVTDEGLRQLDAFPNLTSLNLLHAAKLTDAGLKGLAPLKKLDTLTLDSTRITDAALAALQEANLLHALAFAKGPNARRPATPEEVASLNLPGTAVTDAGLKQLAAFTNLTSLTVASNKVTDEGLKELAAFKKLTALSLRGTKVTAAGVQALQKELPLCRIVK